MVRSTPAAFVTTVLWITGLILAAALPQARGENLTVSVATMTYGHSPLFVAETKGFYAEEGLQVSLPVLESGSRAVQALLGGSVQLAVTTPEDVIRAREAGTPTIIVAAVLNGLTHSLMANSRFKGVGDLRGGKLAASSMSGTVTYALKMMLDKNGLHYPKDYLIIQIGGSGVRWAALKTGGIDAALVAEPLGLMAEEAGLNNLGSVGDYLPHMQADIIAANSDWAKANRAVVVRFLRALVRTFRWIYNNKEEAVQLTSAVANLGKKFGARGYEIYTSRHVWPLDGSPTMAGIKVVLDHMRDAKIISSSHRPESYLDLSYLKQAQRDLGIHAPVGRGSVVPVLPNISRLP